VSPNFSSGSSSSSLILSGEFEPFVPGSAKIANGSHSRRVIRKDGEKPINALTEELDRFRVHALAVIEIQELTSFLFRTSWEGEASVS
jgi:hypothetical protein